LKTLQIGLDWFPERAGGLQRYFYDLMLAAPSEGVDVAGVVTGSPRIAIDTNGAVVALGAMSAPLPSRLFGARRAIGRALKGNDIDLVASHFSLYTFPALDLIDRPIVVHFQGPWASEGEIERDGGVRRGAKAWIEGTVYRRARRCIVLSEAFGAILHERYRIPWDRIRVIPGAIDLSRFAATSSRLEARQRLGWPTDRPILLSVRRLVRRMGLESLIAAMRDVVRIHPEALLLIGGLGPIANELAVRIAEYGLEQNVRLIGFIADDDLAHAYRAADVSIVPTVALEGFGLIAAESLAVGTPALVTPIGGLPEVVRGLSEALIFPSASAEDLSRRIAEVLSGSVKLPDAEACRAFARERYGWDTVMGKVKAVYDESIRG
jgi:glycosyltransferase involved in cell wall biosynthesis